MLSDLELLGVERERGKAAMALFAEPGTRRYVGSAFVTLPRFIKEDLWKRVQDKAGGTAPSEAMRKKHPSTQWLKPGLIATGKHLRGEEKLRHASLQDFREDNENGSG